MRKELEELCQKFLDVHEHLYCMFNGDIKIIEQRACQKFNKKSDELYDNEIIWIIFDEFRQWLNGGSDDMLAFAKEFEQHKMDVIQ